MYAHCSRNPISDGPGFGWFKRPFAHSLRPPKPRKLTTMTTLRILRLKEVTAKTGLSRSTIYALIGRGRFPRQIRLSQRAVGWYATDVDTWLQSRRSLQQW